MKISDLIESKRDVHTLAKEFMDTAEKNVHEWFGTGTFSEICHETGNCAMVSEQFIKWLKENGVDAKSITVHIAKNPTWSKRAGVTSGSEDDAHTAVLVGDNVIDFTARQFDPSLPFPRIIPLAVFKSEWLE